MRIGARTTLYHHEGGIYGKIINDPRFSALEDEYFQKAEEEEFKLNQQGMGPTSGEQSRKRKRSSKKKAADEEAAGEDGDVEDD